MRSCEVRQPHVLALALGLLMAPAARAEPPAVVQQGIDHSIRYVGDCSCEFRRNDLYGVVAVLLASRVDLWRWRVMIVLAAIAMVSLVALARMYLGAHYLSDVLAAFAEAVAWLSLWLTGIHTYWEHRFPQQG